VAFCTQNVVPGIDFSNDPLLQGRNFSYLDTQLKRLGGPNFAQLQINRPKGCPMLNFQQDGHGALRNPHGRVNYEPNSWNDSEAPKETKSGYRSFPEQLQASKVRERSDTFADHYSQARQFWISQTRVEKQHIIDSFSFELSKVKTCKIRERIVGHLRNIDEGLAMAVGRNLGLSQMPAPIKAARPTRKDLKPSKALSIVLNNPASISGRKLGIFCTEGADVALVNALKEAASAEGLAVQFITQHVGGVSLSDGTLHPSDEKSEGGPSVLFDAIALLISDKAVKETCADPIAKNFVSDAFMHCKFIAYNEQALALLKSTGIEPDGGMTKIVSKNECTEFINHAKKLRFWDRTKFCPESEN